MTSQDEDLAAPSVDEDDGPTLIECRYTRQDGLAGWLEMKRNRGRLYGDGTVEATSDFVRVRGWERTWLGTAIEVELSIPRAEVTAVVQDGRMVAFEWKRQFRPIRRFELQCASEAAAGHLVRQLPADAVADARQRLLDIREFNRRFPIERGNAWSTAALVAINVVVYAVMVFRLRNLGPFDVAYLIGWGANTGPLTISGQWWRLLTAIFVHGGPLHIFLNMWALWNVGRLTERLYGWRQHLLVYFSAGLLGSVASIVWIPTNTSVGASGAIFGLLGAFLAFLAVRREEVPPTVFRGYWFSTLVFVLFNLINGAMQPSIDNAAHVGGLCGGVLIGWLLIRPQSEGYDGLFPARRMLQAAGTAAVLMAAGLWLVGGFGTQLSGPDRYWRDHQWYQSGENTNVQAWQTLMQRAASGTISDQELEERLERDVLPFWKQANTRLTKEPPAASPDEREFAGLVREFVGIRLNWVQTMVDAIKANDRSAIYKIQGFAAQATRAQAAVERVILRANYDHHFRGLSQSGPFPMMRRLFRRASHKCVAAPAYYSLPLGPNDSKTDGPALADALGCRAQELFMSGDYRQLDEDLNRHAAKLGDLPDGNSSFEAMFSGLENLFQYGGLTADQMFGRTADWRRAVPGSVEAELAEAAAFEAQAWLVRGGGTVKTVSSEAWALFNFRIDMEAAALKAIALRARAIPAYYDLSMEAGLDQSIGTEELRMLYANGIRRFPADLRLYSMMLRILMPRWGGSYQDVDQFIDDVADQAPGARGRILYARLYWMYAEKEGDDFDLLGKTSADWSRIDKGFHDMIDAYPKSDFVLNGYAYLACRTGHAATYREIRPRLKGHESNTAWTQKWTMQSCDKTMSPSTAAATPTGKAGTA